MARTGDRRGRIGSGSAFLLLAATLLTLAPAFTPATTAQESGSGEPPRGDAGSSSPSSEYEVHEDGTLIIGGDVGVRCRELPRSPNLPSTARAEARATAELAHGEAIRACTEAGFPPAWDLGARISGLPGEARMLLVVVVGAALLGVAGALPARRLLRSTR